MLLRAESGSARAQWLPLVLVAGLLAYPGLGASGDRGAADRLELSAAAEGLVSDEQVRAAAQRAMADRNLGAEVRSRVLRWNTTSKPQPRRSGDNALWRFLRWLGELTAVAAGGARWVLIVLGAVAAAFLGAYLWRLGRRGSGRRRSPPETAAPTHIRGLDIRPEQLPVDVAAAAQVLWNAGQQRAALVLLYRGALSRLVHAWRVPIRDSSTEGECVRLAHTRLSAAAHSYLQSLLAVWVRAMYAATLPLPEEFAALCRDYSAGLQAPPGAVADAGAPP